MAEYHLIIPDVRNGTQEVCCHWHFHTRQLAWNLSLQLVDALSTKLFLKTISHSSRLHWITLHRKERSKTNSV